MHAPFPFFKPDRHQIVPAMQKGFLLVLLSFAVLCALPSLAIGALLWWRASKTWDARERWSGIWLMATLGSLFYGVISWFWHPLPSLLLVVFVDLSHRALLGKDWLYRAYAGNADEKVYARRKIKKLVPHLADLSLTFEGFFDGIAGALDGQWGFEDGDAIYLGLDGDAHKEQAALMGRYLLEDCAHYARYRKGPRHAFVVIDEFGVLESTNATDLYERVREPGMSICASAQSYESLGPERDKIVASSSVKILHRYGDPQEIVKYAGEREVPAFSHILEEDEEEALSPLGKQHAPIRRTAIRTQRQFALPIEEVQQLAIGKIALITGGLGARSIHLLYLLICSRKLWLS